MKYRSWPGVHIARPAWMPAVELRMLEAGSWQAHVPVGGFMFSDHHEWLELATLTIDVASAGLKGMREDQAHVEASELQRAACSWRYVGVGAAAARYTGNTPNQGSEAENELVREITAMREEGLAVIRDMPLNVLARLIFVNSSLPVNRGFGPPYFTPGPDVAMSIAQRGYALELASKGMSYGAIWDEFASLDPATAAPNALFSGARIQPKADVQPVRGEDEAGIFEHERSFDDEAIPEEVKAKWRTILRVSGLHNTILALWGGALFYVLHQIMPGLANLIGAIAGTQASPHGSKYTDAHDVSRFDQAISSIMIEAAHYLATEWVRAMSQRLPSTRTYASLFAQVLDKEEHLPMVRSPVRRGFAALWLTRDVGGGEVSGSRLTSFVDSIVNEADARAQRRLQYGHRLTGLRRRTVLGDDLEEEYAPGFGLDWSKSAFKRNWQSHSILKTHCDGGYPILASLLVNRLMKEVRNEPRTILEYAIGIAATRELLLRKTEVSLPHPRRVVFNQVLAAWVGLQRDTPEGRARSAAIRLGAQSSVTDIAAMLMRERGRPSQQTVGRAADLLAGYARGTRVVSRALEIMRPSYTDLVRMYGPAVASYISGSGKATGDTDDDAEDVGVTSFDHDDDDPGLTEDLGRVRVNPWDLINMGEKFRLRDFIVDSLRRSAGPADDPRDRGARRVRRQSTSLPKLEDYAK